MFKKLYAGAVPVLTGRL